LREVIAATHPTLAVTGASGYSLTVPSALGLVIDSGRIVQPLDTVSEFATGVFCVGKAGLVDIIKRQHYRANQCVQAIQSGPILIDDTGHNEIMHAELASSTYERLVIGVDTQGAVHVIFTSKAHLYDVTAYMIGSLNIRRGINIGTGAAHSAVWTDSYGGQFVSGNLDGGIPTAIVDVP
jgi:uncharacterized protein YigE (DUF2233 family)